MNNEEEENLREYWNVYINKRVLLADGHYRSRPIEAFVQEISVSGKFVKFKFGDISSWSNANDYEVIEVLDD